MICCVLRRWGRGTDDAPVTKLGAGHGRGTCTACLRMTQSSPLGAGPWEITAPSHKERLASLVASLSSNLWLYTLKPCMLRPWRKVCFYISRARNVVSDTDGHKSCRDFKNVCLFVSGFPG